MLKRIFLFLIGALIFPSLLFAQTGIIYGTIKDEQGNGIELVNIAVQGTSIGVSSRPDGSYELDIPAKEKSLIVFSNVSFELQKKISKPECGRAAADEYRFKKESKYTYRIRKKR